MCLITQKNIKSLVATKDLKVYKSLIKREDGSYVTLIQHFPVKLNNTLVPIEDYKHSMEVNDYNCTIRSGYIHAYTTSGSTLPKYVKDILVLEAYIPKGTEYFVDINFKEVCAKKLYITDKVVEKIDYLSAHDEVSLIVQPIIDWIPIDKVSPGWVYTINKEFLYIKDIRNPDDVIGIAAHVDGNHITVFSLHEYYSTWRHANKICSEYSEMDDDIGKWTLPSKEILQDVFINNLMQINVVLFMLTQEMLDITSEYWVFDNGLSTLRVFPINFRPIFVRPSLNIYYSYVFNNSK